MVRRCTRAPRFGHIIIVNPSITLNWCHHWINRYKLYFFCVLVVHMHSTFPNHSHGIRNPFTLQFAFQKGGIDVSRGHSIELHKVTGRRGNIPPLSRFICGRRCLKCRESHGRVAFAFYYFTKRDSCLIRQTSLAVDLGLDRFFAIFRAGSEQTARRRNREGVANV